MSSPEGLLSIPLNPSKASKALRVYAKFAPLQSRGTRAFIPAPESNESPHNSRLWKRPIKPVSLLIWTGPQSIYAPDFWYSFSIEASHFLPALQSASVITKSSPDEFLIASVNALFLPCAFSRFEIHFPGIVICGKAFSATAFVLSVEWSSTTIISNKLAGYNCAAMEARHLPIVNSSFRAAIITLILVLGVSVSLTSDDESLDQLAKWTTM